MPDPLDSPPITSIDPTQGLIGSEIVSREIDPVLLILLLTADHFLAHSCKTEHWETFSRVLRS